jgi:hypothetical protein
MRRTRVELLDLRLRRLERRRELARALPHLVVHQSDRKALLK